MRSEFRLTTALRHGSTKIDDIYFSAPFKLMHPFVNGRHAEYMISFVGPGFLDGDEATMDITFGAGTEATISTQSYEKVFDTKDGSAHRSINLTAQDDAKAVFLPFPVIPFRNSNFLNTVTAHVSLQSTFLYADVVTNGRAGMGEQWLMRRYDSRLRIYVDHAPVQSDKPHRGRPRKDAGEPIPRLAFAERLLLNPSRFDYTGMSLWRNFTHCGMLYIHTPEPSSGDERARVAAEDETIDRIRAFAKQLDFPGEFGVTRATNGVVVRILATRGDDAFNFITDIAGLF